MADLLIVLGIGVIYLLVLGVNWVASLFNSKPKQQPINWQAQRTKRWEEKRRRDEEIYRQRKEQEERHREKQKGEDSASVERMWSQHQDLIAKFFEISHRRVSVLDDYGDESWGLLPKQIAEVLGKIAEREAIPQSHLKAWLKMPDQPASSFLENSGGKHAQFRELGRRLESAFREHHERQRTKAWQSPDNLSGVEFETYVANILKRVGFEDVRGTPTTGDQGADLLARKSGQLIAIQAKRYKHSVGNKAVQEIAAAVQFYGADEGWVVTTSSFTPAAKALAQKSGVRLVDGTMLRQLAAESAGRPN